MQYLPEKDFYPTNPGAAICDYYGVNWDEVWHLNWSVPYGETVEHTLELPCKQKVPGARRTATHVHISLYRMPSGTYEAITYRC